MQIQIMHELVSLNKLCEYISWILRRINFLDFDPFLKMYEVVSDVNVLSPLMMNLMLV